MATTGTKKLVILLLLLPLIISFIYTLVPIRIIGGTFDTTQQVKFMTYNIHFGVGMDDELNLERIVQNIRVENPDIIGLQEVENGRITSGGIHMAEWIARALGMYYYYYPAVNEHAFGCALLSRYPIVNITAYDMPTIQLERVLIHGTIQLNSTFTLDVFVTHLGLSNDNTTAQIQFILDKTSKIPGPKVLMGDFNLWNNTPQIKNVTSFFIDTASAYNPSNPGDTFPSWPAPEPGNRIDYIFATNFTALIDSHVVTDMIPGIHAAYEFGSDHLPVVTTLQY
ncbi:MAG: endonuclease/exonuclease/phosphatase family protein [Candidatus Helarchaeota archaeon]